MVTGRVGLFLSPSVSWSRGERSDRWNRFCLSMAPCTRRDCGKSMQMHCTNGSDCSALHSSIQLLLRVPSFPVTGSVTLMVLGIAKWFTEHEHSHTEHPQKAWNQLIASSRTVSMSGTDSVCLLRCGLILSVCPWPTAITSFMNRMSTLENPSDKGMQCIVKETQWNRLVGYTIPVMSFHDCY